MKFPPVPLPQSLYGGTDGRTLTSQPKFLGSIDYQISLAMVLCWRASARAPLKMPGYKTQRKLFLSPFEWKTRHSSVPVTKCHSTLNKILRRGLKATITLKEAENDVLKKHILRGAT